VTVTEIKELLLDALKLTVIISNGIPHNRSIL